MADKFEPDDFRDQQQERLYELIDFQSDGFSFTGDVSVHDMFWDVMYNDELSYEQRVHIYDELAAYLAENYDLDFEALWDWEEFREWYDSV